MLILAFLFALIESLWFYMMMLELSEHSGIVNALRCCLIFVLVILEAIALTKFLV